MPPSRSGRFFRSARLSFLLLLACSCVLAAGERKNRKPPTPAAGNEDLGLKNIPLTIGHEAKGLVLPNYDVQGRLVGRFEAAVASRIDDQHVRFTNLKMVSFDEQQ